MKKTLSILIAGAALAFSPLVAGAQEIKEQFNNTGATFYNWCKDYPEGEGIR